MVHVPLAVNSSRVKKLFIVKRKFRNKTDAENRGDRVIGLDNIDNILVRAKRRRKCREKPQQFFSDNSTRKQLIFIFIR